MPCLSCLSLSGLPRASLTTIAFSSCALCMPLRSQGGKQTWQVLGCCQRIHQYSLIESHAKFTQITGQKVPVPVVTGRSVSVHPFRPFPYGQQPADAQPLRRFRLPLSGLAELAAGSFQPLRFPFGRWPLSRPPWSSHHTLRRRFVQRLPAGVATETKG